MNQASLPNPDKRIAKKQAIFKSVAILLPLLVLLVIEMSLRIMGYGFDLSLFAEDPQNKGYLVMNPQASKRYFMEAENATIGSFESFRKRKSPETFRIFVLGESTTLGYPYMHNAAFHRWLLYRLMHTFPDRRFEVINLSLTAVNSYTVLGFAKELVNYHPDAVLIYCGQNEYYGTLGVGSTSQLGNNRFIIQNLLRLRSLRIVQLAGNAWSHIRKRLAGSKNNIRETLMKRMAAKQEIPFNSPDYLRGIRQFKTNMEEVCQTLAGKHIPVFISNLVSNEKDLKPFISAKTDIASSAEKQYELAESAYKNNDFAKAKQLYVMAKDLDLLRFRAPEAMNDVIVSLTQQFPMVHLVDTKKLFEANSPHGIIGSETILEHVHPNILGYGLMSEAFYQAIKQERLITQNWKNEIPFTQLRREMPITTVDSLKGTYEIQELKEAWPFNQEKTFDAGKLNSFEEHLAANLLNFKISWNDALKKQMDYYLRQNDRINVARVAEAAALQYPTDETFLNYAGKFCMNLHQYAKAQVYYQHSFRLAPNPETAQALAILYLKTDEPEKSLTYLNLLNQNNQTRVNYSVAQALASGVVDLKHRLEQDSLNVDLLNQIALNYLKMQNLEVAQKYAGKAAAIDTQNQTSLGLIAQIQSMYKLSRQQP
jgi:Uncharacterized enzyme of heme biosynthesis